MRSKITLYRRNNQLYFTCVWSTVSDEYSARFEYSINKFLGRHIPKSLTNSRPCSTRNVTFWIAEPWLSLTPSLLGQFKEVHHEQKPLTRPPLLRTVLFSCLLCNSHCLFPLQFLSLKQLRQVCNSASPPLLRWWSISISPGHVNAPLDAIVKNDWTDKY